MERSSNLTTPTALAGVAVLIFVFFSAYFVGYFSLSSVRFSVHGERIRIFGAEWQATVFHPATKIESLVTGEDVETIVVLPLSLPKIKKYSGKK